MTMLDIKMMTEYLLQLPSVSNVYPDTGGNKFIWVKQLMFWAFSWYNKHYMFPIDLVPQAQGHILTLISVDKLFTSMTKLKLTLNDYCITKIYQIKYKNVKISLE